MSVLRIVSALFGWLLSYLWIFAFAGPAMTTCTQGSDHAWLISLVFYTPALFVGLALVAQARRWNRWLRWGALPHLLTILAAGEVLRTDFAPAVLQRRHLCDAKVFPDSFGVAPAWWHAWYWPIEIALLIGLGGFICWFSIRPAAHAA